MVIVELIGSISLAIALVSAILLFIVHIKYKQNEIIYHQQLDNEIQIKKKKQISTTVLPVQELNIEKRSAVIDVIRTDASSPIKYGIQWAKPSNEETRSEVIDSPIKNAEFDQGDSLSLIDQNTSIRELIDKFKNMPEKNNQTDSDLTSIDTNYDNQTLKTDLNQNEQNFSHHSSISNFDVTIPSNLSSSIDLEQFECVSTTSNLSEFLKD